MEPFAESQSQPSWNRDYVYFIGMVQHQPNLKVCKIGRAHDLNKRMAQLQTGNPYKLFLLSSCQVDDAVAVEADLHRQYALNRIPGGEWFELTDNDIRDVKRIMSEIVGNVV